MSEIKGVETAKQRWTRETVQPTLRKAAERRDAFTTLSGLPVQRLYTPEDVVSVGDARDRQPAGEDPYVRGGDGFGQMWTMRAPGGAGTPDAANRRWRDLIGAGATGLSVAVDAAVQAGRDPDHPQMRGLVGQRGLSIASLADMERLFDGIALETVTPALAVDGSAAMILAMYLVVAEQRGTAWHTLSGSVQHDVLGHAIATGRSIFPTAAALRLVRDVVAFCATEMPHWEAIAVSGYQLREAGASAVDELTFALRTGIAYVQDAVDAGIEVDLVASRLSFVFGAHSDFFEEIAKLRAARKLWAEAMRDGFGATAPRAWQLRSLTRTSAASHTSQQPHNNVVRTALQAMAAVLGGTGEVQTAALDETSGAPASEPSALALRTQQIIAHESGVAKSADPLGGSYFVETLTREIEQQVRACWTTLDRMGGIMRAIDAGYPQQQIAQSAARLTQAIEHRHRVIVGLNDFVQHDEGQGSAAPVETVETDETGETDRVRNLVAVKAARNRGALQRALSGLGEIAAGSGNVMPALLDCARAYATLGEMCDVLRTVWGEAERRAPRAVGREPRAESREP